MLCKICYSECQTLGTHLRHSHGFSTENFKKYYDEFERKDSDGICPSCGKETKFRGLTKGYLKYCSSRCSNSALETIQKKKESTKEKYGDENFRNIVKSRATRMTRYGRFNSPSCI